MIDTGAVFQYGKMALGLVSICWIVYILGLFFWRLLHGRMSFRDFHKRYW